MEGWFPGGGIDLIWFTRSGLNVVDVDSFWEVVGMMREGIEFAVKGLCGHGRGVGSVLRRFSAWVGTAAGLPLVEFLRGNEARGWSESESVWTVKLVLAVFRCIEGAA